MVRLYQYGAETLDANGQFVGTNAETFEPTTTGNVSYSTTVFRTGTASYKCSALGGGTANISAGLGPANASTSYFMRAYLRFDNLPASTATIMSNNTGSPSVAVRLTSTGKFQLWDTQHSVQIGSDSAATVTAGDGKWWLVEHKVTNGATQCTGAEAYIDGTLLATTTSLANLMNGGGVTAGWITTPTTAGFTCYVDDVAANDSTGSNNTGYCGPGAYYLLIPISDNGRVGWTAGAGATTSLFAGVDNLPPVGVAVASATNTSQIKDAANNTTDTYSANMTTYTSAGIPALSYVSSIRICCYFAYSNAASSSVGLQMTSNPAITEATNTNNTGLVAGTYPSGWSGVVAGIDYAPATLITSAVTMGTSPVLRVRKNTASSSRTQTVCAMFASVDVAPIAEFPIRRSHQAVNRAATI